MTAMPLSANEARSCHLSAQFCLESHHTSDHIDYVRGRMSSCLAHMQKNTRSLLSLHLLSFITPRHALDRRNEPVFVILHCWRTVRFSTVEALLTSLTCPPNDFINSVACTLLRRARHCTPLDIEHEIRCPDFTLNPLFIDFVRMSSKDSSPNVDTNLFLRVGIEGDSDAQHATIA
jgi:hypothetical protein